VSIHSTLCRIVRLIFRRPSNLRKSLESISDPKYEGVRTTRDQLLNDTDGDSVLTDESDVEQYQDGDRIPEIPVPEPSTTLSNRQEDRKKGKAVARQIVCRSSFSLHIDFICIDQAVWDTLLDARIRLQKAVTASNILPLVRPHTLLTIHHSRPYSHLPTLRLQTFLNVVKL
jgi:protein AATF/BFR2